MTIGGVEIAHSSHVGVARKTNEDYLDTSPENGIVVLADGMGGHNAGEVASKLAVETAMEELLSGPGSSSVDAMENLLRVGQAVEFANQTVFGLSCEHRELSGMGTTLVIALFRGDRIYYAHVGDSRLYRYRGGSITCLTTDHSLIQEVVDHGIFYNKAEAREAGVGDNVLTRSLGLADTVNVDVGEAPVHPGDLYLVCSDGLNSQINDKEICRNIAREDESLEDRVDDLMEAALDAGGRDNISLVLVRT